MHFFRGRLWLGAAVLLLLGLSSPLALAWAVPARAMTCCCSQDAAATMPLSGATCCYEAPAPLPVTVIAPTKSDSQREQTLSAPAILTAGAWPQLAKLARVFRAPVALAPPESAVRRLCSCRAPPR